MPAGVVGVVSGGEYGGVWAQVMDGNGSQTHGRCPIALDRFRLHGVPWGGPVQVTTPPPSSITAARVTLSARPHGDYQLEGTVVVTGQRFPGQGLGEHGHVIEVIGHGHQPLLGHDYAMIDSDTVITVQPPSSHHDYIHTMIPSYIIQANDYLSNLCDEPSQDQDIRRFIYSDNNHNEMIIGPRFSGKTHLIHAISSRSTLNYVILSGSDLPNPSLISNIAYNPVPVVLVIDDLDHTPVHHLPEIFASIDALFNILAVWATVSSLFSSPLPSTVMSRFPRTFHIPIPSLTERSQIFHNLLDGYIVDASIPRHLATITPSYLPGQIVRLCRKVWSLYSSSVSPNSSPPVPIAIPLAMFTSVLSSSPRLVRSLHHIASPTSPSCPTFAGYPLIHNRLMMIVNQWSEQSSNCLVHGVLLYGPSGCGKTLICRSISADPRLNSIIVNASDIFSKYLGDSEKRIRDIFRDAREQRPCIVFIDDIDVIGRARDGEVSDDSGVGHRVLSTLLNELDGISGRDGVFLLAASNRIDRIDSALIRPGRFDLMIEIGVPSQSDRIEILKSITSDMPLHPNVALSDVCSVDGETGADLRDLARCAALLALYRDHATSSIMAEDFHMARFKNLSL